MRIFASMDKGMQPDSQILIDILETTMPFGKYKGTKIWHLPVSYLEWFAREGFPAGKMGMMLETCLVIKSNGLEHIMQALQKKQQRFK